MGKTIVYILGGLLLLAIIYIFYIRSQAKKYVNIDPTSSEAPWWLSLYNPYGQSEDGKTVGNEPTAVDWINSVGGFLGNIGAEDWLGNLFGGKKGGSESSGNGSSTADSISKFLS